MSLNRGCQQTIQTVNMTLATYVKNVPGTRCINPGKSHTWGVILVSLILPHSICEPEIFKGASALKIQPQKAI